MAFLTEFLELKFEEAEAPCKFCLLPHMDAVHSSF